MSSNSKAITKLKKRYSKIPSESVLNGFKNSLLRNLPAFFILWLLRNVLVNSEYRLRRESIKFFQLSNVAYGANECRRSDRMLVIAFGLIDRDFDADYVALTRNTVRSTLKNSKKRFELSEILLADTKRLEISMLDASGWYQLSRGLFCLGYFRAAWVARENSLDLSIFEALKVDASSTEVDRGVQAHFERGNFEIVSSVVKLNPRMVNLKMLLDLLTNSVPKAEIDQHSKHAEGDKLFDELIRGKTVALVGASVQDGAFGAEIDSADTVFRIRFAGTKFLQQEMVGSRCDIAQFNDIGAMRNAPSTSAEFEFIDGLKCVVVFSDGPPKLRNIHLVNLYLDVPIYRSTAVSGLVNLLSVIKMSPAQLKLFGFDFYSRFAQYNSDLLSFYAVDGWKFGSTYATIYKHRGLSHSVIAGSFSAHDPVSNFCFAQNLYKAGLFDIEPYGKSILELTPYQYVERLEEMLGNW